MPRTRKTPDFENSLAQLEAVVERMEQGDLPIEDALKAFEEGVKLTRECQTILDQTEQKVQVLIEQQGELKTRPFDEADAE
ncbi:MAG: exodeoxyribonuclease VII small subunit [Oceanospirillaceae bacterium]|jgi:exodeoxyribonuclease VII small subunit|uniref:exodeoxyribonuclease VII small subunit n=1 Tax=Marinobacterium litorale TaxID=404770 RepID=UPI0003F8FB01|nr:exodeoxyribonuclease VII small subunit [Marinobacterium litorale]MBS98757.1 exodeoxyribonuclease VII small subunit [Oceanospirillaceae bacterium]